MAPATETPENEIDMRHGRRSCRVCREVIHSGDIAYRTTLHNDQISSNGRLHYWTCSSCQGALDGALTLAARKVGAAC